MASRRAVSTLARVSSCNASARSCLAARAPWAILGSSANRSSGIARPVLRPLGMLACSYEARWYSANAEQTPDIRSWSFEEIEQLLHAKGAAKEDIVIVDVREPNELTETGQIPGAINIPIVSAVQSFHVPEEDFEAMYGFERPSQDKTLLFYCKAGVRAKSAAGLAQHAGWKTVGTYDGSWNDWEKRKGPVEKVNGGQDARSQGRE